MEWTDYDVNNKVIDTIDEKRPFRPKLPSKELYKSVTEVKIDDKKLFVLNIFYTSNRVQTQGTQAIRWVTQEYETLKEAVSELSKKKTSLDIDETITGLKFPDFLSTEPSHDSLILDLDLSQTFEKIVDKGQIAKEIPGVKDDIPVQYDLEEEPNNNIRNKSGLECNCKDELSKIQSSLHKIEHLLIDFLENKNVERLDNQQPDRKTDNQNSEEIKIELNKLQESLSDKCNIAIQKSEKSAKAIQSEICELKDTTTAEIKSSSQMLKTDIDSVYQLVISESKNVVKANEEIKNIIKKEIEKADMSDTESESESDDSEDESPKHEKVDKTPRKPDKRSNVQKSEVSDINKTKITNKAQSQEQHEQETVDKHVEAEHDWDCWILGSSIIRDLIARKMYRRKRVKITTLREKTIRGAKSVVKNSKISPASLVLQIGSNDLDFEDEDEPVIQEMVELLEICKSKWQNIPIIVG